MIELLILVLALIPGFALILRQSPHAITYYIVVFATNRGVRRLVDYYLNGHFNESSLISLAPKLLAVMLVIPLVLSGPRLPPLIRQSALLIAIALAIGVAMGLQNGPFGLIVGLLDYLGPVCALFYAVHVGVKESDLKTWMATVVFCAAGVAAYCIYQFCIAVPPWDVMWIRESKMLSIGGWEPFKIRAFGPMGDPGLAALFIALATGWLLLSGKMQNPFTWLLLAVFVVALLMIRVRTAWLVTLAIPLVFALLSPRGISRGLLSAGVALVVAVFALPLLPGSNVIADRVGSLADIRADGSFQGRSTFYADVGWGIVTRPLGNGLGSTGLATRYSGEGIGAFESGFLDYFFTFGLIGGALWYAAFFQIGRYVLGIRRAIYHAALPEHSRIALAMFVGQCATLASANILKGEFAVILFAILGVALVVSDEDLAACLLSLEEETPAS